MSTIFQILFASILIYSVQAAAKPRVIFIGGYRSTDAQMQMWEQKAQAKLGLKYSFTAYPLLSSSPDERTVITEGRSLIKSLTAEIDQSPANSKFILVGHSSGSAISSEVAKNCKDKGKIKLILLDGFEPLRVPSTVALTCWSAGSTDGRLTSMNIENMKSCDSFHRTKINGCRNRMCLHFSLVNLSSAKVGVNSKNFGQTGYDSLEVNLRWLDQTQAPAPVIRQMKQD